MTQKKQDLQKDMVFKGMPLSKGVAVARVCMFNENRHSNLPMYKVSGEGKKRELARLNRAVVLVEKRLGDLKQRVKENIGAAEAEIFSAHSMILKDQAVLDQLHREISDGNRNAETAVRKVFDGFEARFRHVDDEFMRERATDFGEIKGRVLDALGNMKPSLQCAANDLCLHGRDRIIVAEELTPSLTLDIDVEHTVAFVTEHGGKNSHAAILARAMGVPAVSGLQGIRERLGCGVELLVDGYTGEVVVWPSEATVRAARGHAGKVFRKPDPVEPVPELKVMANISLHSDIHEAKEMRAEGIGLYRTEFELIAQQRMFSEDEMYERYIKVLDAFSGSTVVIRAFDIGSDKSLPFLNVPREENPSLGWRGARLLLGMEDIFKSQARALARLSVKHRIDVMYPMIVDLDQFLQIRKAFDNYTSDIDRGEIHHGVMFEVPSACMLAEEILAEADFGSVGSNDLTQYLFAVDRENDLVSYDYDSDRPVFWTLMKFIADAGKKTGKTVSICGEMAGEPQYIEKIISSGINTVSVSPRRIPALRLAVAEIFGDKVKTV